MSHHTIHGSGASLDVRVSGTGPAALLFLHYWGGSARTWRAVTDRLDRHARCFVLDQRGWGDSSVTDGRYDLQAMADDVQAVVDQMALDRFVLVGHSMGGKVAQIVATRRPAGLAGLVLVAPAPPTPMIVTAEQREAMLESYQSRQGVLQALSILAGSPLPDDVREQVIADTLRGAPAARRAWIENGMTLDVASGQRPVTLPVQVVVGSLDRVEREAVLRETLPPLFPEATFRTLGGVGHLSPLEAPEEIARSCVDGVRAMLDTEGQTGPEAGRLPCCAGIG